MQERLILMLIAKGQIFREFRSSFSNITLNILFESDFHPE